jgi:hypothetical protein
VNAAWLPSPTVAGPIYRLIASTSTATVGNAAWRAAVSSEVTIAALELEVVVGESAPDAVATARGGSKVISLRAGWSLTV